MDRLKTLTLTLTLTIALVTAGAAAEPSTATQSVAILDEGMSAAELDGAREGVRKAGFAVLSSEELRAALAVLAGQGITCALDEVPCLAKIALLAEAEAVVTLVRGASGLELRAVDATPRMGSARAPSSAPDDVAIAVWAALSARASSGAPASSDPATSAAPSLSVPPSSAPPASAPPSDEQSSTSAPSTSAPPSSDPSTSAPSTGEPSTSAPSTNVGREQQRARPMNDQGGSPWSLAGAGLAGAGVVALAAGGYAALLAGDSMQRAEAARFQDDTARFGDEANTRLWLGGGAIAIGVGALAGGAVLVFGGDP